MILRDGKEYFIELNQPFRLILLTNKVPNRYKVKIDFDESSKAWRKNKIHLGKGMFKYKK